MKRIIPLSLSIAFVCGMGFALSSLFPASVVVLAGSDLTQKTKVTVRTENFPRPPYSGATYYIYEMDGNTVCTKLEVCNKFGNCSSTYKKGSFKEDEDVETGEPYGKTAPVVIATAKLKKHVCLTKFKLIP